MGTSYTFVILELQYGWCCLVLLWARGHSTFRTPLTDSAWMCKSRTVGVLQHVGSRPAADAVCTANDLPGVGSEAMNRIERRNMSVAASAAPACAGTTPSPNTSRWSTTAAGRTRPWATALRSRRSTTTGRQHRLLDQQPEELSKVVDTAHTYLSSRRRHVNERSPHRTRVENGTHSAIINLHGKQRRSRSLEHRDQAHVRSKGGRGPTSVCGDDVNCPFLS